MAQDYSGYPGPPLRAERKEIRVLELLPTTRDSGFEASCILHTVSLLQDPKPHYSALSYVWGDPTTTKSILLNGRVHNVTKNLAAALRTLTSFRQDRLGGFRLWVDAICINQSIDPDNHEKNEQVSMLGELFANAEEVLSWLGDDARIPKAYHTLVVLHKTSKNFKRNKSNKDPQWLEAYPELYSAPENEKWIPSQSMASIRDFVELPYWSRMWIFQEIVLARPGKLTFFTPIEPYFISGEDLRLAFGLGDELNEHFLQRANPEYISEAMFDHLKAWLDLTDSCRYIHRLLAVRRRLHEDKLSRADRASLCLLSAFRHNTRATNPLDYYYSLLGVSQLDLKPNYSDKNPVEAVCVDFINAYIDATRESPYTLLFLHDALGTEAKAHHLPSWAPRYHLPHTMQGRHRGLDSKADADKGVFEDPPGVAGFDTRIEGLRLSVEGIMIGAVQLVSDQPSRNFLRPGEKDAYLLDFERRHNGSYVTGVSCATAYFSTLMRDEGGPYEGWRDRITMQCLSGLSGDNSAQEREAWRLLKEEFAHSLQEAISRGENKLVPGTSEWSRTLSEQGVPRASRLFEFEGGYLGLALQHVEIGDVVCVLKGSQYPIVLRTLPDDVFQVVGTCFVLGLMKGEARAFLSTGRRVFHIV